MDLRRAARQAAVLTCGGSAQVLSSSATGSTSVHRAWLCHHVREGLCLALLLGPLTCPIGRGARIAASVAETAIRAPTAAVWACGCTAPARLAAGSYQSRRPRSGGSGWLTASHTLRGRAGQTGGKRLAFRRGQYRPGASTQARSGRFVLSARCLESAIAVENLTGDPASGIGHEESHEVGGVGRCS